MSARDRSRLDVLMVERGLTETRARAQSIIMGGGVTVDGEIVTKPSQLIPAPAVVELKVVPLPYVSRGGLKLRHALETFCVPVAGAVAADIGASTGGFTDVLLQEHAKRVYAIDVGYGQLAWTLRNDARVVVMERTNIRHLVDLPEVLDLAVIDTSFISLRHVLPAVSRLIKVDGFVIALVKPQFEAGKGRVPKGVVRDPQVWRDVLTSVTTFAYRSGWVVRGLERSPIRGPAGNVEFLLHLIAAPGEPLSGLDARIGEVTQAWQ